MAQNSLSNEEPELNYFVCTLGQAAVVNEQYPRGFKTVNNFLDHQARVIPQNPAVGFPAPSRLTDDGTEWQYRIFSMSIATSTA